jgi:hypothetical protein
MFKRLITLTHTALIALAAGAVIVPDTIASRFADRVVAPIEGVWQFADDGATVAVYADTNTSGDYKIVCLDSPDLRLASGSVLGWASASLGDGAHYTAQLYTDVSSKGIPTKMHKFTVTVKDGIIEMTAVKNGLKFDLWMLYRFFVTMSLHRNDDNKALKARRTYPDPIPTAQNPVIL